ncbi:MAG TPA: hypothetical protein VF659_04390 [Pyrinomonadaceae bacterium]|jgi:hypothetical protein
MSKTFRVLAGALLLTATLAGFAGLAGFAAEASGSTPAPAPQATPPPAADAITFHNNTLTDFSATSGEPIIKVGDGALAGGETTGARRLRFNNPSNEPFTVEFQIVGQLPRGSGGMTPAVAAPAGGTSGAAGTPGSGTNTTSAGALVTSVLRVTYNPLVGTATVERLK